MAGRRKESLPGIEKNTAADAYDGMTSLNMDNVRAIITSHEQTISKGILTATGCTYTGMADQ